MGIRGLTTYISKNSHLYLKDYQLHDTYLVIDGNSLSAQIYKFHCKSNDSLGGDYDKFKRAIIEFFNVLDRCQIIPLVLLDGGFEWRKLNTLYDRMKNKVQTIQRLTPATQNYYQMFPCMQVDVFKDVLIELNVRFVVCDFEADIEIAMVARQLNCPVLSYDSDFYIYDVLYIPFPTCSFQPHRLSENRYYVPCKIYKVETFLDNFGGLDKNQLPLLATLLGNDYVRKNTFNKFFAQLKLPNTRAKTNEQQRTIAALLEWLRHETVESAERKVLGRLKEADRTRVSEVIKKSSENYKCDVTKLMPYLKIGTQTREQSHYDIYDSTSSSSKVVTVPAWFIEKYREGLYPTSFINLLTKQTYLFTPQMEDLSLLHSHDITIPIVSLMGGLLTAANKYDHIRYITRNERDSVQSYYMIPTYESKSLPIIPTIEEFHTVPPETWYGLMAELVQIDAKENEILHDFPDDWKFFIVSIIYWAKHITDIKIQVFHMYALIMCALSVKVIDKKGGYYRSQSAFSSKNRDKLNLLKNKNIQQMSSDTVSSETLSKLLDDITHDDAVRYIDIFISYFTLDDKLLSNVKNYSVRTVHMYAEFQSVFRQLGFFNALVGWPFMKTNIADFYNGTFIYNACMNFKKRNDPDVYISNLIKNAPTVMSAYKKMIFYFKLLFPDVFK